MYRVKTHNKALEIQEKFEERIKEHCRLPLRIRHPFPFYIRFKPLPTTGYSKNFDNGHMEIGTSCFHAKCINLNSIGSKRLWRPAGESWEKSPRAKMGIYIWWKGLRCKEPENAHVFLVTGQEEDAKGSDGEPLLTSVKTIAELIPLNDDILVEKYI